LKYLVFLITCSLLSTSLLAQRPSRIGRIDNQKRHVLAGHIHPALASATDLGSAPDSLEITGSLSLQPSAAQTADLNAFLERLQDPSSADYHKWLSPEQFADRFGATADEVATTRQWLESQGLTVVSAARARNRIAFQGPVRKVEQAFGTRIHRYQSDGEIHFANATAPSVPEAFANIVGSIACLHDFRLKPHIAQNAASRFISASGRDYLAPDDVATIYNLNPLYAAGINGTGQKLAVVGQTQVSLTDLQQFRSANGLPPNDPQITLVPGLPDPGIVSGDSDEAHLDLEWSAAVARNASVIYVYSENVFDALIYAVDQNVAPVISMSYGLCEQQMGTADLNSQRATAQQAVAQGITWLAASGDNGAADCWSSRGRTTTPLAVDAPGSIPEVTSIGGTEFSEGSGTYWNKTNTATQGSAVSYIPETTWNDSTSGDLSAGGGGASILFSKPSWQTGPGVPADGFRDVPDISFSASPSHDAYLFYTGGKQQGVGGTSAGAPVMAGVVALLNQYAVANGLQSAPGQGNINPRLYALAQSAPSGFHDVTTGNNQVNPCQPRATGCNEPNIGYAAGPGYDQATGLGSIDAFNLITSWKSNAAPQPFAVTAATNAASFKQVYAPGMILAVFGTSLAGAAQSASSTPLPLQLSGVTVAVNGIAAPLYYVSPTQVNLQIPYSAAAGSAAVTVSYNGQTTTANINIAANSPGIFINTANNAPVPNQSAARGQTATLFITGDGAESPQPVTGALPDPTAATPKPTQPVSVTVGGIPAALTFVGVPSWSVGVTQINYTIPNSVSLGAQPVVVTVGSAQSAPATITITQ
jgi:uncharacterized protein (TIGR03437 family)